MAEIDELEALLAAEGSKTAEIDSNSLDDFNASILRWVELRNQYDRAKKLKAGLEAAVDSMAQAIISVLEAKNLKSIRLKGIGLISSAANNNPNIKDPEAFYAWLHDVGEDGIIKRTAHYLTVKSLLNQRVEDGKSLPSPEVVELTSGRTLKLIKDKT